MSTIRRQRVKVRRGPDGKVVCSCGCGRTVQPPRRNWYSQDCVEDWRSRNDPQYIRQKLLERDRGICALCGVDCEAAFAAYRKSCGEAERLAFWLTWANHRDQPREILEAEQKRILARWKPPGSWLMDRRTGWDADHIIPVAEGGGGCGIEGYRTLCHACHQRETKALAARLAERRRQQKIPLVQTKLPLDA